MQSAVANLLSISRSLFLISSTLSDLDSVEELEILRPDKCLCEVLSLGFSVSLRPWQDRKQLAYPKQGLLPLLERCKQLYISKPKRSKRCFNPWSSSINCECIPTLERAVLRSMLVDSSTLVGFCMPSSKVPSNGEDRLPPSALSRSPELANSNPTAEGTLVENSKHTA
ncbi:hypothetical protein EDD15DRAFT_2231480 [Pisolithus albus]|nr:hypothetical protein EDD15DRAFT_2231480 [Pisolithus albus]